jgi:type I restriction enzyme, R subunit
MSTCFSFLDQKLPDLSKLAIDAENYAFSDPESAAVKLRSFVEQYLYALYSKLGIAILDNPNLYELMSNLNTIQAVPPIIIDSLHIIRKTGNRAAHSQKIETNQIIDLLKHTHNIASWMCIVFYKANPAIVYSFSAPVKHKTEPKDQLSDKEIEEKEAKLKELTEALKEERRKLAAVKKSNEELKIFKQKSIEASRILRFNEDDTRKQLIDIELGNAGWFVNPDGADSEYVGQEIKVDNQPTPTGIGYADYVLWDDNGLPLAIIEAKRYSKDPTNGQKQAELYADSLENKYAQRPIIFLTNGHDIIIWNDAAKEAPRKIYGFYSKDSLQYVHFSNKEKLRYNDIKFDPKYDLRMYQTATNKSVVEKFGKKYRKALIVLATGTGKTRVAVSLCDAMMSANWAKRILFLCDRRELRKQANNVFSEYIPTAPLIIVSSSTYKERDKRIYLATYPGMMTHLKTFDVGFFDLIIADESHRSIYNKYKEIFDYFDAYQVGLTATPVEFVQRNTYSLFQCGNQDPTSNYSYEQAVLDEYLVPYEVETLTTKFLRDGIKYSEMTRDQQLQYEEQSASVDIPEYSATQVEKQVFNLDTERIILKNLMENGIQDESGSHPGHTIIFARNHEHAVVMAREFNSMYPQYGGKFCQVIDTYNDRAEQLIDDFKGIGTNNDLTIAISVDMLDTGIDIPEVVNLVFAKPVKSYVKFWQMIGRGTRLCKNLFGRGIDKEKFRIFDHWGNFDWFSVNYKTTEPSENTSLMQYLFNTRISLAEAAQKHNKNEENDYIVELIAKDVNTVSSIDTIPVKDRWKELQEVSRNDAIKRFSPKTANILKNDISPLMKWVNIRGNILAYRFDHLIVKAQIELLVNSNKFEELKDKIIEEVSLLKRNLNQVKMKQTLIDKVLSDSFWDGITVLQLDRIRKELRDIMKYKDTTPLSGTKPELLDIEEEKDLIRSGHHDGLLNETQMLAYKKRVEDVLNAMFDKSITLQKIRKGLPVNENELNSLVALILTENDNLDINTLYQFFPDTAGSLDLALRRIIGIEAVAVNNYFTKFTQNHNELTAKQITFLNMLKNLISKNGAIKLNSLYEDPFTTLHNNGVDGIFPKEETIDEIFHILDQNKLFIRTQDENK